MTDVLAEFLLARIADDEAVAREASARQGVRWFDEQGIVSSDAKPDGAPGHFLDMYAPEGRWMLWDCEGAASLGVHEATSAHIARWDPARVLAECQAKRRIVEEWKAIDLSVGDAVDRLLGGGEKAGLALTMRLLALPYADHDDYRQEWAL